MRSALQSGERILIEGTQGYGLSLLHSDHYPNVTSRDTTAAAFLAEAGLSPLDVDEVVLVLRAFPIRVAGHSGDLPNEIDWRTVTKESGAPTKIEEKTTVTKKIRRVARFDPKVVVQAIEANAPTRIVLNHVDYIDYKCVVESRLTPKAADFVSNIESQIGFEISDIGIGPGTNCRICDGIGRTQVA